jgi:hypothetical protein
MGDPPARMRIQVSLVFPAVTKILLSGSNVAPLHHSHSSQAFFSLLRSVETSAGFSALKISR